jgi:hypothetical protein
MNAESFNTGKKNIVFFNLAIDGFSPIAQGDDGHGDTDHFAAQQGVAVFAGHNHGGT